jgi:acetyl esterase/lipase
VRFAGKSATQWGGDPSRLVLAGHSAGAYIAAMLSFDPQWLRQVGLNSQADLAGFIGLAGPYYFLPIQNRTLRTIFGGANRVETQPISFVTGKEAPALLITARRDRLVSPGNSRRMVLTRIESDPSRRQHDVFDRGIRMRVSCGSEVMMFGC